MQQTITNKIKTTSKCLSNMFTKKRFTKYALLIVNLILLIFSGQCAVFYSHHLIRVDCNLCKIFIGPYFSWLLYLFICIWVMVIIYSIYGIWTSITENPKSLRVLHGVLFVAFIINIAVSSPIIISMIEAPFQVNLKFNALMENYQTDGVARFKIDTIQREYQCCGFMEPDDWSKHSVSISNFTLQVPSFNKYCKHQVGCYYPLNLSLYRALTHILLASICLSLLLLFGFMLSGSLRRELVKFSKLQIPRVHLSDAAIISDGKSVICGSDRPPYDYLLKENEFSYVLNEKAKF